MIDSEAGQKNEVSVSLKDLAINEINTILGSPDKSGKTLRVYRGLCGEVSLVNGQYYNSGFEDEQLRDIGLFLNNFSFTQNERSYTTSGIYRRVVGLPVFLTTREGLMWIEGKRYKKHPAISVLDIPLSLLLDGDMKIVRNGLDPRFDYQLTEEQIVDHISGGKPISGECYLTHISSDIKQFQRIIVPNQLNSDGKIDFESGFKILD